MVLPYQTHVLFLVLSWLIDGAVLINRTLYPYGSSEGDRANPRIDDDCSIVYSQSISMLGKKFSQIYVCTNGVLSLDRIYTKYMPQRFLLNTGGLIAPFLADGNPCRGGNVWSRETRDPARLQIASKEVRNAYKTGATTSYTATWMMIATWDNVLAYSGGVAGKCSNTSVANSKTNTFQAVIVSDGKTTFAMFHYKSIKWVNGSKERSTPAQVGFDAGDGVNSFAIPNSQKPAIINITGESNVGIPGKMIFKLGSTIMSPDKTILTAAPTILPVTTVKSTPSPIAVIQANPPTRRIPLSPPTMHTPPKPSSPLTPVAVNIPIIATTTESLPSSSSIGRINATLSSMDQKTGAKRVRKMYRFAIGTEEETPADPTDVIVISCVSVWVVLLTASLAVSYVIRRQLLSGVARKRPDKNISEVRKFSVI